MHDVLQFALDLLRRLRSHMTWPVVVAMTGGLLTLVGAAVEAFRLLEEHRDRKAAKAGDSLRPAKLHAIPLRRLIGWPVFRRRGIAVRMLRACDLRAAEFYRHIGAGTKPPADAERIWSRTVTTLDRAGQKAFVAPAAAGTAPAGTSVVGEIRERLLGDPTDGRARVWIRGPAGAGKSTLLLHVFFVLAADVEIEANGRRWRRWLPGRRPTAAPVPMLVQPRNVFDWSRQQLTDVPDEEQWIRFVGQWFDNRNINLGRWLPDVASDLSHALEAGDVVLVLDGYDELYQMHLGPLARKIVTLGTRVLCAERSDDERQRPADAWVVQLSGEWTTDDIRRYVERRWDGTPPAWTAAVFDHLKQSQNRWLRTPRYAALLLGLLEGEPSLQPVGANSTAALRDLTRGEDELLDCVFSEALERKEAAGRAYDKAAIAERLAAVAVMRLGVFIAKAQLDDLWRSVATLTEIVAVVESSDGTQIRIESPLLQEFFLGWHVASDLRANRLPAGDARWTPATL